MIASLSWTRDITRHLHYDFIASCLLGLNPQMAGIWFFWFLSAALSNFQTLVSALTQQNDPTLRPGLSCRKANTFSRRQTLSCQHINLCQYAMSFTHRHNTTTNVEPVKEQANVRSPINTKSHTDSKYSIADQSAFKDTEMKPPSLSLKRRQLNNRTVPIDLLPKFGAHHAI